MADPGFTLDEHFMRLALREAQLALDHDDVPVGAVVVLDGEVVGAGRNERELRQDPTAHAEVLAIREASRAVGHWRLLGCVLYVTLEPCAMCAGAAYWAGVGRVVYGLSERDLGQIIGPHPENLTMDLPCRTVLGAGQRSIEVVGPLLEDESRAVHEGFWR